jgi:hypothetical protein
MFNKVDYNQLSLVGSLVLKGEVWRIFSFMFLPVSMGNPLFVFIAWYFYYLIGNSLENYWGSAKFSLYVFLGWGFLVISSLILRNVPVDNYYIFLTMFFAIAHLYPDMQIYIMFIIPVKIKWMALLGGGLQLLGFVNSIIHGAPLTGVVILFSMGNYLIFFGKDLYHFIVRNKKKKKFKSKTTKKEVFHQCYYCGNNDKSHKDIDFRYIEDGEDYVCICTECLEKKYHEDK